MKESILACPICGGRIKLGRSIPPKGIFFSGIMGKRYQCMTCKREIIPVEFDTKKDYINFLKELESG
jgi:DNA-directed RNA polymerase subunit RPC12/RpoP